MKMNANRRVPVPRDYPHIWDNKIDSFLNLESTAMDYKDIGFYKLYEQLGAGYDSTVHEAENKLTHAMVALKVVTSHDKRWLRREVKILGILGNGPNIVRFMGVTRFPMHNATAIILEKLDRSLRSFHTTLNDSQIRNYAKQILGGLDYIHSKGIIHFDIKPHNLMIHDATNQIKIIDFASASIFCLYKEGSVGPATLAYKSPEILVNYSFFNYAVDIWSFACVLAEMVSHKYPFFIGENKHYHMIDMIKVLGSEKLKFFFTKYEMNELPDWCTNQMPQFQNIPFQGFLDINIQPLPETDALDLIRSMLQYDPEDRLTAGEALKHKFFVAIKNPIEPVPSPSSS